MTANGTIGSPAFPHGGPGPTATRIAAVDALRGLAVLGILVINIEDFSMPFGNPLLVGSDSALDHSLWTLSAVYVEGTMRGLFTLLFGAGVILFTSRAQSMNGSTQTADLYYRRVLWLSCLGLFHMFVLLQPSDILLRYGLAGLVLFSFRSLSPTKLVLLAALILALFSSASLVSTLTIADLREEAESVLAKGTEELLNENETLVLEEWAAYQASYWPTEDEIVTDIENRTGDWQTLFLYNADSVPYLDPITLARGVGNDLMMMFLGMALMAWGILNGTRSIKFYLLLTAIGYGIGLPLRIWEVWSSWATDFDSSTLGWRPFAQCARVAVTLGHVGLFFLLWGTCKRTGLFRALTAVGRLALTNYIAQTVIANLIFTSIGLSWFGLLDRAQAYLVMACIWITQVIFSLWWLSRFRFGPLEWLWRSLTYWRAQPMRRTS
jgi:uncharacterized protein